MNDKILFEQVIKGVKLRKAIKAYWATRNKISAASILLKIHETIKSVGIFILKFWFIKKIYLDGLYPTLGFEKTIILLIGLGIVLLKVGNK